MADRSLPTQTTPGLDDFKAYLFVCPDCGAHHTDTANDYPMYSCCQVAGHRKPVYAQVAIVKWLPRADGE